MQAYIPSEWQNGEFLESIYQEFKIKPTGQHSAILQRLVNWLRSDAMNGKLGLLCTVPHQRWELIRMNGRGRPITLLGQSFDNIHDAELAIFRRRVHLRLGYLIRAR